jgi:hypothetical protein
MSSSINPNNINGNYPVAGQDNDSQGFRDNFTNIRNNLSFTKSEIEDLQNKVVLKSPLTGTSSTDPTFNNFNGAQIVAPQLRGWTQALVDQGTVGGSVSIDYTYGNFQKITPNSPVSLNFTNWPGLVGAGAIGYGSLRLWFYITDTDYTITLPSDVNIAVSDISGYNSNTRTISFDTPGNYVFDISSADGGDNYMIFDVIRNRVRFRDSNFYFNEDVSPTMLIGFGEALELAIQLATGNDILQLNGSQTNYAGVLDHNNDAGIGIESANPIYAPLGGNAAVAGYSVGTSRAYINEEGDPVIDQTALVQADDYIGYVNFLGATLNPVALPSVDVSVCDFATIRSYVSGNSPYSPGGNLVLYTKADTITSAGYIQPALSIENDQSVNTLGPLVTHGAEVSSGYQFVNLSDDSNFVVSAETSVVLVDSDDGDPVLSANIIFPPILACKDGQKVTIASNVDVAVATVAPGVPGVVAAVSEVSGINILTLAANPYIAVGMIVTGANFLGGQVITSIIDNGLVSANVTLSAAPTSAPSYGASVTLVSGGTVNGAPTSLAQDGSSTWIYRSANTTWYKIG